MSEESQNRQEMNPLLKDAMEKLLACDSISEELKVQILKRGLEMLEEEIAEARA